MKIRGEDRSPSISLHKLNYNGIESPVLLKHYNGVEAKQHQWCLRLMEVTFKSLIALWYYVTLKSLIGLWYYKRKEPQKQKTFMMSF